MDSQVFTIQFAKLLVAFPRKERTQKEQDDEKDLYWERLQRFPNKAFVHAVESILDNCEYFPKISEIRKHMPPVREVQTDNLLPAPKVDKETAEANRAKIHDIIGGIRSSLTEVEEKQIAPKPPIRSRGPSRTREEVLAQLEELKGGRGR